MSDGFDYSDRVAAITALEGSFGSEIHEDRLKALEHLDATPNDELRALVKEWRDEIEPVGGLEQKHDTLAQCADELEALIEATECLQNDHLPEDYKDRLEDND